MLGQVVGFLDGAIWWCFCWHYSSALSLGKIQWDVSQPCGRGRWYVLTRLVTRVGTVMCRAYQSGCICPLLFCYTWSKLHAWEWYYDYIQLQVNVCNIVLCMGILLYLYWISSSCLFFQRQKHLIQIMSTSDIVLSHLCFFNGPPWRLHAGTLLQLSLFNQKDVLVVSWSKLEGFGPHGWVVGPG